MAKEKTNRFPEFETTGELIKYFDDHDLGDYLKSLPEVNFDVDIRDKTNFVMLDDEVSSKITTIAIAKNVPSEALINSWLQEKCLSGS